MVEPSESPSTGKIDPSQLRYPGLRWAVRLTGFLVMIGGAFYLAIVLWSLFPGSTTHRPGEISYTVVATLLALGLGYFVIRVGWTMMHSVDPGTISMFSLLFSLVFTPILFHLLPAVSFLYGHPVWLLVIMLVYFGLSYLILNRILLFLLFPPPKTDSSRL